MIIYQSTKKGFVKDIFSNKIDTIILNKYFFKTGMKVRENEQRSWRNSLSYVERIVNDPDIPDDSGVVIEYNIPQTSKRIDFIITGLDESDNENVVLIELKQWESAQKTELDGIVLTKVGYGGPKEVSHPSYQVWSYAMQLKNYNQTVYEDNINLYPCAYLHNYSVENGQILDNFYNEYIREAPLFLKEDALKLQNFIKKYIKKGDRKEIIYRIDNGNIKPTKSLVDSLSKMLDGNQEFIMIDDQKVVYEKALSLAMKAQRGLKQVLVVEGGPGTGKSVVAINLLVELHNKGLVAQYVSKNAAPRKVYESKLTGKMRKTHIYNLFKGSGSYTETDSNTFDTLIVDEAHRLNEKSGLYSNRGENQIKEIIQSSKFAIFFIDEDQRVHFSDIGEKKAIFQFAEKLGSNIHHYKLSSQFRCNGSDGYLAWLDNKLQIRSTPNYEVNKDEYEFRVFDNPEEMASIIREKNKVNNKARMVAGYCWDWVSRKDPNLSDIVFDNFDFKYQWNLNSYGNNWIIHPDSVNEIGCIHTCQGLEVDYIGVIIGDDLVVRNNFVKTQPEKRAKTDQSLKGFKKLLTTDPKYAKKKAEKLIKNTYRTLMTRGMKGCYLYCTDRETSEYFKSLGW